MDMGDAARAAAREPSQGYQLRVVQEVLLALLAGQPAHGYELRARLQLALGPLAEALNAGQVYVTLTRLEKAGLLSAQRIGQADRPDRKVYGLTAAGRERVMEWLEDTSWPKPAPAEFHLKLVAAAAAGLAVPALGGGERVVAAVAAALRRHTAQLGVLHAQLNGPATDRRPYPGLEALAT
jgi:DNA-binding PadR family transcriptional regulator